MLLPVPKRLDTKEDLIKIDSVTMNLNEKQDAIARNIYFLELALVMPFDHPIKALIRITNKTQYQKYQHAVNAHLHERLAQEYRRYADLYYKENIYFFNNDYYEKYLDGYDIAEFYFKGALTYRRRAQEEAQKARAIPGELNPNRDQSLIDFDEKIYKLTKNPYDFEEIFEKLLTELEANRKKILELKAKASSE
ncbi:hypothetical protein SAMN02745150_00243 [Brevinema andersonii]|uniref:Uncharacterized protein n=2 Tax=Brevinema andersonii TaxID=34097 RepID=A0A1I1D460_BREAD|nr:hypothetical protein SAMN02745150_00243 [Brevinema andersonii]